MHPQVWARSGLGMACDSDNSKQPEVGVACDDATADPGQGFVCIIGERGQLDGDDR